MQMLNRVSYDLEQIVLKRISYVQKNAVPLFLRLRFPGRSRTQ